MKFFAFKGLVGTPGHVEGREPGSKARFAPAFFPVHPLSHLHFSRSGPKISLAAGPGMVNRWLICPAFAPPRLRVSQASYGERNSLGSARRMRCSLRLHRETGHGHPPRSLSGPAHASSTGRATHPFQALYIRRGKTPLRTCSLWTACGSPPPSIPPDRGERGRVARHRRCRPQKIIAYDRVDAALPSSSSPVHGGHAKRPD